MSSSSWKNPYITDGLVAMWDAEWNNGFEKHSQSITKWKDLCGSNDLDVNLEYASWNSKSISLFGLQYDDNNDFAVVGFAASSVYTIELVANIPSANLSHGCFIATGFKSRGMGGFGGGWMMSAVDRQFYSGQCLFHGNTTTNAIHHYAFVYESDSNNNDVVFYDNGQIWTGTTTPYGASTNYTYNLLGMRSNATAQIFTLRLYSHALDAS